MICEIIYLWNWNANRILSKSQATRCGDAAAQQRYCCVVLHTKNQWYATRCVAEPRRTHIGFATGKARQRGKHEYKAEEIGGINSPRNPNISTVTPWSLCRHFLHMGKTDKRLAYVLYWVSESEIGLYCQRILCLTPIVVCLRLQRGAAPSK